MRPTLRQLEYIIAIAETGQISLAAAKLNVSQPSLSAQLAEVEADLGVAFFIVPAVVCVLRPWARKSCAAPVKLSMISMIYAQLSKAVDCFRGDCAWGFFPRSVHTYCPA